MSPIEVRELLQKLHRGIGQRSVALECQCDNLETVYVSLTSADEVLVSDSGRTFGYLSRETDSHYRPMAQFDMASVAEACRLAGVSLNSEDPEGHPRIETTTSPTGDFGLPVVGCRRRFTRRLTSSLRPTAGSIGRRRSSPSRKERG